MSHNLNRLLGVDLLDYKNILILEKYLSYQWVSYQSVYSDDLNGLGTYLNLTEPRGEIDEVLTRTDKLKNDDKYFKQKSFYETNEFVHLELKKVLISVLLNNKFEFFCFRRHNKINMYEALFFPNVDLSRSRINSKDINKSGDFSQEFEIFRLKLESMKLNDLFLLWNNQKSH